MSSPWIPVPASPQLPTLPTLSPAVNGDGAVTFAVGGDEEHDDTKEWCLAAWSALGHAGPPPSRGPLAPPSRGGDGGGRAAPRGEAGNETLGGARHRRTLHGLLRGAGAAAGLNARLAKKRDALLG